MWVAFLVASMVDAGGLDVDGKLWTRRGAEPFTSLHKLDEQQLVTKGEKVRVRGAATFSFATTFVRVSHNRWARPRDHAHNIVALSPTVTLLKDSETGESLIECDLTESGHSLCVPEVNVHQH